MYMIYILKGLNFPATQPMNSTRVECSPLHAIPIIEVSQIPALDDSERNVANEDGGTADSVEEAELGKDNEEVQQVTVANTMPPPAVYRCEGCGKICQTTKGLNIHKKKCEAEKLGPNSTITLTCPLCDTVCANSSGLLKHKGSKKCKSREEQRSRSVSLTLALSSSDSDVLESLGLNCMNCKRSFKTKAGIASHMRVCKQDKKSDKSQAEQAEITHEAETNDEEHHEEHETEQTLKKDSLKCDVCDKDNFKTKTGLMNHKRLIHGKKTGTHVKKIDKKTIDKNKRLSMTLPVEIVYPCPNCGLKCTTNVGLKLHFVKCRKEH